MTDFLVELALSNLLISAAMALLAYAVHRRGRYPGLAHLLWVLVLVKAVTPPLLTLPIFPSIRADAAVESVGVAGSAVANDTQAAIQLGLESIAAGLTESVVIGLLVLWAVGSVLVLAASLFHIYRFDQLLRRTSIKAPAHVQLLADDTAVELGLRSAPAIYTSVARLSPMTWWLGRHLRIVIPAALEGAIGPDQLRWVLAHELAHVKRRDYLVRWLEWLACVSFWWNPVVWWSRHNLRIDEEISCDALVLERLGAQPRSYAKALLTVMEFLSAATSRQPALATGISVGGSLEHRFTSIISGKRMGRPPRWLAVGLTGTALLVMTLGVSAAAEPEIAQPVTGAPEITSEGNSEPATLEPPRVGSIERQETPLELVDLDSAPLAPNTNERSALLSAQVGVVVPRGTLRAAASTRHSRRWDNVFVGTAGADDYSGSGGRDRIVGKRGPDRLSGGGRHDLIRGGKGHDIMSGNGGPDHLIGGPGNDTIFGGGNSDLIRGGDGSDTIRAGTGNDIVKTWRDGVADTVDCGAGDKDRAIADSTDTLVNCEFITIREPA